MAKAAGNTTESHSRTVARGKFIHEIQRHDVRPECADEYKKVLAEYYPKLMEDDKYKTRLKGSWEVTVGDLETFCERSMLREESSLCCRSDRLTITSFALQITFGNTTATKATTLVKQLSTLLLSVATSTKLFVP